MCAQWMMIVTNILDKQTSIRVIGNHFKAVRASREECSDIQFNIHFFSIKTKFREIPNVFVHHLGKTRAD